jgi:hypothetical protein
LDGGDSRAGALALTRATLSLRDEALRAAYVSSVVRSWGTAVLAPALDELCSRAEQGEAASREALIAVVDALNQAGVEAVLEQLREEALRAPWLALERLVRRLPSSTGLATALDGTSPVPQDLASMMGIPARRGHEITDARGRPLTLGERKSLARRPDRETLAKLMSDPHPDVIFRLLRNPRLTEDDVVRLAAKRPGKDLVLAEIAKSTKWLHRPRVRMALVLNPSTPVDVAARITGLLLRSELELAATSPGVAPSIRALCNDHLARRPPVRGSATHEVH